MRFIKIAILATMSALLLLSCQQNQSNPCEPSTERKVIEPGEQAPPASPGQNNFGGMISSAPRDTTGMAERMRRMREEQNRIRTVHDNYGDNQHRDCQNNNS